MPTNLLTSTNTRVQLTITFIILFFFGFVQTWGAEKTDTSKIVSSNTHTIDTISLTQSDSIKDRDADTSNEQTLTVTYNLKKYIKKTYAHKEEITFTLMLFVLILCLIILLITKTINHIKKIDNQNCTNNIMQILLIAIIITIGVLSDSSWSHLVLIILCVIALERYNPGILNIFTKVSAALHGNLLDIAPSTQKDLDQKRQAEALEEEYIEENQNIVTTKSVKEEQDSNSIEERNTPEQNRKVNLKKILHSRVQEHLKVEQLALKYLEKEYPNLQKSIRLRINSFDRIDLDGLVQNDDNNIIIEIKFCRSIHSRKYDIDKLYKVAKYIFYKTEKITEILLFVVVESNELKQKLKNLYTQSLLPTNLLQVKVYTLTELEQSISNTSNLE